MATDLLTSASVAIDDVATDDVVAEDVGSTTDRADTSVSSIHPGSDPPTAAVQPAATSSPTVSSVIRDYVELTKPRIVTMILVTTVATAIIGAGGAVAMMEMLWLLLGTGLIASSAGAANQIWERVIDCEMTRTANRPLPGGRMTLMPALIFTSGLGLGGAAVLGGRFGLVPAAAGVGTWMLYVLVYTPMKTRTAWNTTVGAIAGALPVLIGFTATGGQLSGATGWLLFGVLATWQYPHFMAIAWMYRRQYDEAGFKMTTTVEPTGRDAAIQSIAGSLALIACGIALCFMTEVSWFAGPAALGVLLATVPMLRASIEFARHRDDGRARKLLRSSLLVLPAVLLIVTLRVFW